MLFNEAVVSVCCLLRGVYFNFVFSSSVTKEGPAEYEVCVYHNSISVSVNGKTYSNVNKSILRIHNDRCVRQQAML